MGDGQSHPTFLEPSKILRVGTVFLDLENYLRKKIKLAKLFKNTNKYFFIIIPGSLRSGYSLMHSLLKTVLPNKYDMTVAVLMILYFVFFYYRFFICATR